MGEHQCLSWLVLGCILIVIVFVSEKMALFEGHSANRAGREQSHPSFCLFRAGIWECFSEKNAA